MVFGLEKHATFSGFIFEGFPFWEFGVGLILFVSENGYGKRSDVDQYRLQFLGGKGVINMKATPKVGKVSSINPRRRELMVISQFGKIIRIDTKSVRTPAAAPRA